MTLRRAYDEIMEHVTVTEQMHRRILSRVEKADLNPSGRVAGARSSGGIGRR